MLGVVEGQHVVAGSPSRLGHRITQARREVHAAAQRNLVRDGSRVVGDAALDVPADALPVPPHAQIGVVDQREAEDGQDGDRDTAQGRLKAGPARPRGGVWKPSLQSLNSPW